MTTSKHLNLLSLYREILNKFVLYPARLSKLIRFIRKKLSPYPYLYIFLRRTAKLFWWILTFKILMKIRHYRASRNPVRIHNFEYILSKQMEKRTLPAFSEYEVLLEFDNKKNSEVTICIPNYNYAKYIEHALNSVKNQTITNLDLVLVDDHSTDHSLPFVKEWIIKNRTRFNRAVLARNKINSGLVLTRNTACSLAKTQFIFPFDSDNFLFPKCIEKCLISIKKSGAFFAYPTMEFFGEKFGLFNNIDYHSQTFLKGNYIDAMALIRRLTWAVIGGYSQKLNRLGVEDHDFWLRCVEFGFFGVHVPKKLARYRIHRDSMLQSTTKLPENQKKISEQLTTDHPWIILDG